MITPHDRQLIIALPDSDFGRAFLSWVKDRLEDRQKDYFLLLKIDNDDIRNDFRFKAGFISALQEVLGEPERLKEEYSR